MFEIKSYILMPGKVVTDLKEASENPEKFFIEFNIRDVQRLADKIDSQYVDGVIIIKYYQQIIMDFSLWDSVNHLWAFILNIIEESIQKGNALTYFPGCPVELHLTTISDELVLFQIVSSNVSKWTLPKKEFFNSLLDGAKDFFENMVELFGCNVDYDYELNKINELKVIIN